MKVYLKITRKVLFEKYSIQEEMEWFFLSFFDGCEIKLHNDYPDFIFYIKNDKLLFEQELKNKYFYVRYSLIWSVFETKYLMEREQIQAFMKGLLEKHLKLEGYTPERNYTLTTVVLEEHMKLNGYTHKPGLYEGENMMKLEGYLKQADVS